MLVFPFQRLELWWYASVRNIYLWVVCFRCNRSFRSDVGLSVLAGSWGCCVAFGSRFHKKALASCEPTCIGSTGKLENVYRCPYKLEILSQLTKKDLDTQAGRLNFCSTNCISVSQRINRHCLQSDVQSLGYSSAFSGSGITCSDISIV